MLQDYSHPKSFSLKSRHTPSKPGRMDAAVTRDIDPVNDLFHIAGREDAERGNAFLRLKTRGVVVAH